MFSTNGSSDWLNLRFKKIVKVQLLLKRKQRRRNWLNKINQMVQKWRLGSNVTINEPQQDTNSIITNPILE